MKRIAFFLLISVVAGCRPKAVTPINDLIGKIWQAKQVKEGTTVVYTAGATSNVRPGYVNFRLNLSQADKAILTDLDGRPTTGTWSISPDNQRLILENLTPKPSGSIGTVEFYITATPTEAELHLLRTSESRKTGNSVNEYLLVPVN